MKSREIARGGLLAAAAVALLYLGGLTPWIGLAACIAAGVCSAVPLLRGGRVKVAIALYLAAAVLAMLIVPRKGMAVCYVGFTGLYPIIKYGVEYRFRRRTEWLLKLLYFNVVFAVGAILAYFVFLPSAEPYFGALPDSVRAAVQWLGMLLPANLIFVIYDIGLSRLIATLRRALPPMQ